MVSDDYTWAVYLSDTLLSLPGIAIVELPEVSQIRDLHVVYGSGGDCECCPPWIQDRDTEIDYSLGEAREYAAALLAAANAAEVSP